MGHTLYFFSPPFFLFLIRYDSACRSAVVERLVEEAATTEGGKAASLTEDELDESSPSA